MGNDDEAPTVIGVEGTPPTLKTEDLSLAAESERAAVHRELTEIEEALEEEAEFVRRSKRRWMTWGPVLSALAAIGSFGGGAAVALSDDLGDEVRIIVVILAIAFGAAGAAATALRAPERASEHQVLFDQLWGAKRWVGIVRDVSLPTSDASRARRLLVETVEWVDAIHGVTVPEGLRRAVHSDPALTRPSDENETVPTGDHGYIGGGSGAGGF